VYQTIQNVIRRLYSTAHQIASAKTGYCDGTAWRGCRLVTARQCGPSHRRRAGLRTLSTARSNGRNDHGKVAGNEALTEEGKVDRAAGRIQTMYGDLEKDLENAQ
jgi:hypothetical protein